MGQVPQKFKAHGLNLTQEERQSQEGRVIIKEDDLHNVSPMAVGRGGELIAEWTYDTNQPPKVLEMSFGRGRNAIVAKKVAMAAFGRRFLGPMWRRGESVDKAVNYYAWCKSAAIHFIC